MTKKELIDLLYTEEESKNIDTAVPADWFNKYLDARHNLGIKDLINPSYSVAYSYINNNFGEPIYLPEVLLKQLSEGKLQLVTTDKLKKIYSSIEALEEECNED